MFQTKTDPNYFSDETFFTSLLPYIARCALELPQQIIEANKTGDKFLLSIATTNLPPPFHTSPPAHALCTRRDPVAISAHEPTADGVTTSSPYSVPIFAR